MAMRRRVVITGMGCINPMGNDVETMWSGLKEGRSGVDYITIFDASRFPTKIAAEIKNWDITHIGEDPQLWQYRARHTRFAAGAARQAIDGSGCPPEPTWIPHASASTSAAAKGIRISSPSPR